MSDKPASPARGRKKTAPSAQRPPQEEVVVRLPLTDLHPFPDHPFQVRDDEEMKETIQSVKEYGVIVPAIVRPREEGGYEIVAGHRRKYACEQAGLDTMPVLIRNLDRDAATIIIVDSNLQRENILPSERAKAYKMKLEAIKRQGARNDLTSDQVGQKSKWSIEQVAEQAGESKSQVQRYIRLNELSPELLQMVDEKKIAFNPAYELSFLKPEEQQMLVTTIDYAKTREVYVAYRKAGYSKKFRAEHEADILLHQTAKKAFDELGMKKLPTVKSLQAEYAELMAQKKAAYSGYRKARDEMKELLTVKANVDRIMGYEEEKQTEKDHAKER